MSDDATNSITAAVVDAAKQASSLAHAGERVPHLPGKRLRSVRERLYDDAPAFDFFQAVCLLEKCNPDKFPVGGDNLPNMEAIRFRVQPTNSFPASAIYEIEPPRDADPSIMTVTFFGLIGINGALPRHYTDCVLRSLREGKGPEKRALLDWFDLFHHRLISLFHRAWAKYRFPIAYARREFEEAEPDTFTQAMYSLIGLGMPTLRERLNVRGHDAQVVEQIHQGTAGLLQRALTSELLENEPRPLAKIHDLALLRYAGLLTQRPRSVANLQRLVSDFFRLPVEVKQFQGQWLGLSVRNQTKLGAGSGACLGQDAVAGARVWSVESKIRLRIGPLSYEQFTDLLPDTTPIPRRKAFFLLNHLVRLFLGPELDFDVQLVLDAEDVPVAKLGSSSEEGPRLGWNCWLQSKPAAQNADDAVFDAGLFPCPQHALAG